MPARRALARAVLAGLPVLVALLAACTGSGGGSLSSPPASAPTTPTRSGSSAAPPPPEHRGCPAGYVAPDPARPRITLDFDVAGDLTQVRGREQVRFTRTVRSPSWSSG